jgi:hypothetical protein
MGISERAEDDFQDGSDLQNEPVRLTLRSGGSFEDQASINAMSLVMVLQFRPVQIVWSLVSKY